MRKLYLQALRTGDAPTAAVFQAAERGSRGEPERLVQIWGPALEAVLGQVLEQLRASGHSSAVLRRRDSGLLPLAEESGVRLALLFMAVKPLRKVRRIETIAGAVREMEPEEAYYWLAKCTRQDAPRRACHALRVLLSKE